MTILNKIVADKREEVEQRKRSVPLKELEVRIRRRESPLDFTGALRGKGMSLIAEVKQASPSRGLLRSDFDPVKLAETYAASGAAAVSVLTEEKYFRGSLEHLAAVREKVETPLLRKDFIFDPYQVYEARAYGADALLLITAILRQKQLEELIAVSHGLGLSCLVEVHDEAEIGRAARAGARITGINNRDLKTLAVDINTTRRLAPLLPAGCTAVSESGIRGGEEVRKMKEWGISAILVGETLVTAEDIPARIRELVR